MRHNQEDKPGRNAARRSPGPLDKRKKMNRKYSETELKGMTVNERFFALGLIDQFERAAKTKNRQKMIGVLLQCAFSQEQSEQTTDAVLKNPAKYGF